MHRMTPSSEQIKQAIEFFKDAIKTSINPTQWHRTVDSLLKAIKLNHQPAGIYFIKQIFRNHEEGINQELNHILSELEKLRATSDVASYVLGKIYQGFVDPTRKRLLPFIPSETDATKRQQKAISYFDEASKHGNKEAEKILREINAAITTGGVSPVHKSSSLSLASSTDSGSLSPDSTPSITPPGSPLTSSSLAAMRATTAPSAPVDSEKSKTILRPK